MDDPVKQIESVIRTLTQGSPNEQSAALNRYYVPNAEFVHPFCRVPPFENVAVPIVGQANSRQLILSIFRWYRILSPRIDLKVNTVQFDEANSKLYVDISQRFSLWFVPFYAANVNLVTLLHLTKAGTNTSSAAQLTNGETPQGFVEEIKHGDLPSFSEVASSKEPLLSADGGGTYMVAKQEDLYQVNEWIKFIVPYGIGNAIISAWQLFVTAVCLAGTVALFPFVWILTHGGAGGNVMPPVKRVTHDGQVLWNGIGADWARRTFSPLNSISKSAIQGVATNVQVNAGAIMERGQAVASNVQQRGRKLIHGVQAREEAIVKAAQQKAKGLADEVQAKAVGLVEGVQQKGLEMLDAAQQKERELVAAAQRREEELVKNLQAREEQAAENTRRWFASNKGSEC